MAVTSTTTRISYAGSGSAGPFTITWYFQADADILVLVRNNSSGAVTTRVLNTDYVITGEGNPGGGFCSFVSTAPGVAPQTGETLYLIHDPDQLQSLDLVSGSAFPADAFEAALDHVTHQVQRARELIERAPHLADTETDGSGAYDANGNRLTNLADPTVGSDAVTRSYADSAYATASGPGAIPPANSIGNTEFDITDPLSLDKVDGASIAQQSNHVNPNPLADTVSLTHWMERVHYKLREILNNLDAGARTGWEAAAGTNVPTQITNAIAALPSSAENLLTNGSLSVAQREPSDTATGSAPVATDTFVCDRWDIRPVGAGCTWNRRREATPTTYLATGTLSDYGMELVGAAACTEIKFRIKIGRAEARKLGASTASQSLTFGVKLKHTGSITNIQPKLRIHTTSVTTDDTVNNRFAAASLTTRLDTNLGATIAPGGSASRTGTFNVATLHADMKNGFVLEIALTALTGSVNESVCISDLFLATADITTTLRPDDFMETLRKCRRYYQKTFEYGTKPVAGSTTTGSLLGFVDQTTASSGAIMFPHGEGLRGNPTCTTFNPAVAASTSARSTSSGASAPLASTVAGMFVSQFIFNTPSSDTGIRVQATADAEWYA